MRMTLHSVPWEAQPRSTYEKDIWELYNTAEDFSCAIDLATKYPDKLKEMQAAFLEEAVKYNVLPLDDRAYDAIQPVFAGRPDLIAGRTSLTLYPGMIGMKENTFINMKNGLTPSPPRSRYRKRSIRRNPRSGRAQLRLELLRQGRQTQVRLQLPG